MKSKKTAKNKKNNLGQIRIVWGLICSQASIDQEKNNISLFNVIDQLNIAKSEFEKMKAENKEAILVPLSHEVVTNFRRLGNHALFDDELKTDVRISLVGPRGSILMQMLTPIKFMPSNVVFRFRCQMNGFKIIESGDYEYRVAVLQPDTMEFINEISIPFVVRAVDVTPRPG